MAKMSDIIPFPDKKYGVIYADPPWSFKTWSDKGKEKAPDKHYTCMNLDDIKNLPVGDIASDDCVLLMWAIDPMLPQALEVIDAWGFKYKTVGFTWCKTNKNVPGFFVGLGYYVRKNPEMCLLATRGKPNRKARDVRQLVIEPRGRHSEKPLIHDRIERLFDGDYIELFARKKTRNNWDFWGNEV